jgi:FkbM family methyltransferase
MLGKIKHVLKLKRRRRKAALGAAARKLLNGERLVAVDVGAAHGLMRHWATIDQVAHFYLVEPNPETSADLRRMYPGSNLKVLPVALSGRGGKRTLNVTNVSTGSSLLPIDEAFVKQYCSRDYFFPVRQVELDTRSLQQAMDAENEPRVDLIKLDTQGTELEIFEGLGAARLDQVLAVELEVGMPGAYVGQAQLPDVQRFMEGRGLVLFDLRCNRTHRPKGSRFDFYQKEVFGVYANAPTISAQLFEVDAVYFRNPLPLIARKDAGAIRRLLAAYCMYNFFSEAHHVAEQTRLAGVFSPAEFDEAARAIVSWHNDYHRRFYHSPAFDGLRRVLYHFAHATAPRWAQYLYHEYPSG